MKLKDNVKYLCALQGITQKDLAAKIGMKSDSNLNIMLSREEPKITSVQRIAEALDISIDVLISDNLQEALNSENQPEVLHVPYARCPHCGGKIELYIKAVGDEKKPD